MHFSAMQCALQCITGHKRDAAFCTALQCIALKSSVAPLTDELSMQFCENHQEKSRNLLVPLMQEIGDWDQLTKEIPAIVMLFILISSAR